MPTKKRKPFQPLFKHKTLTGGERERSKVSISWLLALSRNDMEAIMAGLTRDRGLATAICHLTGLGPVHWAVKHDNRALVTILIRDCGVSPNMRSSVVTNSKICPNTEFIQKSNTVPTVQVWTGFPH